MTQHTRRWLWLAIIVTIIALFYAIHEVVLPFIIAIFISYALNPAVEKLHQKKVPRGIATFVFLASFFVIIGLLLVYAIPFLKTELIKFAQDIPGYGERLSQALMPFIKQISSYLEADDFALVRNKVSENLGDMLNWALNFIAKLLTNSLALANLISVIVLTPVIAFYLLRDWPKLMETTGDLLPRKQSNMIIELAHEINKTLGGYIRGQAVVCLILGVIYSTGLYLIGLNYAITIGIVTGVLSFIPYFGAIIGFGAAVGIALGQFGDWTSVGMVAIVFAIGQTIEGAFLAPKLIGNRVGLHPVWVIFSLLAAGSLFGFIGLLLALPIAATIGVILRFLIRKYKKSSLYSGGSKK
jgi:predicted PurR-regulated permease PerM